MATMHIDEIKAIARRAHNNATKREGLFDAIQSTNREVAVQSAWALTHLPKGDNEHIARHREALVVLATTTHDTSLRRITMALLERLDWQSIEVDDTPAYYITLLDFCFEYMMRADEPYGVRSLCMKLAYKISQPYPELLGELRQSLLLIEPSELGAGVRHTRNKLLKLISQ
ncbi:MAG: hypothetical protein J6X62_01970 [Bacteroidales bacterium]|nr:hypothetical protein [Bacteroidales bacterium]